MSTSNIIEKKRKTNETDIAVSLGFIDTDTSNTLGDLSINTTIPFFSHMLHAMLFHGGWSGSITATGDTDVDHHHLVEDMGIVLGSVFAEYALANQPYRRFGHTVIPMDDALAECTIDFSNRAFFEYRVELPQPLISGVFDVSLGREFFMSVAHNARINLHLEARYGLNSHHILEALFKSCGKAIRQSLQPAHSGVLQSTKGSL